MIVSGASFEFLPHFMKGVLRGGGRHDHNAVNTPSSAGQSASVQFTEARSITGGTVTPTVATEAAM